MPLYSLALLGALLLTAPWWLFRMLTTARYREGLPERLGRVPQRLRELGLREGPRKSPARRTIWVHAVSVGEVLAASSLVAALEAWLGPGGQVVVSTTTRSGQQLARKRFSADRVFYFPLDFRFAVRAWLRALRPELVLLAESELWPRLLHECAAAGIPVAVVNARVSDRSFRRGLRFRAFWRWMARPVTLWLVQSDADTGRLRQLGIAPERVQTTGNLKYDTRPPLDTPLTAAVRRGAAGRPIVIAGSTVHYGTTPEEGIVLDAMRSHVWPGRPDVLLILAPRHPERFGEAGVLAAQFGTRLCATDLLRAAPGSRLNRLIDERILVLDTIGDLAALYRCADVAFVGGSLLPHGGHNPLEPAQFGVPVLMGPHVENFRDIVARLQAVDGIVLLPGTEPAALGEALAALLADPLRAQAIGQRGRSLFEAQRGATARTLHALEPLLPSPSAAAEAEAAAVAEADPATAAKAALP